MMPRCSVFTSPLDVMLFGVRDLCVQNIKAKSARSGSFALTVATMKIFIKRNSQPLSFRRIEGVVPHVTGLIRFGYRRISRPISSSCKSPSLHVRDAFKNSFLVRARRHD